MSDQNNEAPLIDLSPEGFKAGEPAPEGHIHIEVTISREERLEAGHRIVSIANLVAMTRGEPAAIKDLMLSIEASAIAMRQFTTTGQVLAVLDHIRERIVSFGAFLDNKGADVAAAAEEAAQATKH